MPACGAPLKMPKNTGIDFSPPPAFAEIIPKIAALCDEWRNQQKTPLRRDFFYPTRQLSDFRKLQSAHSICRLSNRVLPPLFHGII